jgi:hypothetical protein
VQGADETGMMGRVVVVLVGWTGWQRLVACSPGRGGHREGRGGQAETCSGRLGRRHGQRTDDGGAGHWQECQR